VDVEILYMGSILSLNDYGTPFDSSAAGLPRPTDRPTDRTLTEHRPSELPEPSEPSESPESYELRELSELRELRELRELSELPGHRQKKT
jgi:hypothetical protein